MRHTTSLQNMAWITLLCLLNLLIYSHASSQPNFVVVLTDDLDLTLGGASFLTKTKRLIASNGAELTNWFVHTPVCCPSRAELLTGRMFHNLKEPNPTGTACMYVDVQGNNKSRFYSEYYFARHFKSLGYSIGIFGKHLNKRNVRDPPPGVDRWFINGGGNYLNPSFVSASDGVHPTDMHFDNCTRHDGSSVDCYSTSVIGNTSISWIEEHVTRGNNLPDSPSPFLAYISVKAPHLQDGDDFPIAVPAPWYQNASVGQRRQAPRTPNYNASCPNHHWLVRTQQPLTDLESSKVDELYISRLRTLLSVDDLVDELISSLDDLGILDNTYVLFTSDNGYRLGQFSMPQGKWHTYENDIRVPMFIRGPKIRPGSVRSDILGTHVDLMPTLLSLANGGSPSAERTGFDGEDLSPLLLETKNSIDNPHKRNAVLLEYIGLGDVFRYSHLEDSYNNTFRTLRIIDPTLPKDWQNVKYVEFTDCMEDWNFTKEPREVEFFDLSNDPYEMNNIISMIPKQILTQLRELVRKLYTCAGKSCRSAFFSLPSNLVLEK